MNADVFATATIGEATGAAGLWLMSGGADTELRVVLGVIHAAVSLGAAFGAFLLLPPSYRAPKVHLLAFFFIFSLLVPLLGAVGLLVFALTSHRFARPHVPEVYRIIDLPHFSEGRKRIRHNYGAGGIRARLLNERLPVELRMRTLLAAQGMPGRLSSPIMFEMLSDPVDDLRLLASGLLSKKQHSIHMSIQRQVEKLGRAADENERVVSLRELAELYWELAYQSLVLGEPQRHALSQARYYALEAVALDPRDGALWALLGRILLRAQEPDKAEDAFDRAVARGYPGARLVPYRAEIAFNRRAFDELRTLLGRVRPAERTAAIDPLIRYWCGDSSR